MSIKVCCCLCCTPCSEHKALQNESGESNDIYEMTVKYFDPMLLIDDVNTSLAKDKKVLCQNCWTHINDFNEFQHAVIKSRTLLIEIDVKQLPPEIKQEEELTASLICKNKNSNGSDHEELTHSEDMPAKNDLKVDQDVYSIDSDMGNDDEDDDTDNKPLAKLSMAEATNKDDRYPVEMLEECATQETKPKTRKVRRPKNEGYERTAKNANNIKRRPNIENTKSILEKSREFDELISQWKPLLECDICNENFKAFEMLKVHFKNNHNTRGYIKCCERNFYRRCDLVIHIRLHIDPETFKCDICGKQSSTKYNLKLHKRTVHEETEPFECEVCHRAFNQKPNLERHLLTHATGSKDFVCEECGKGYVLECQLKSHVKTVHHDDRVCDQCGKTLHGIGALKKHLMEHDGIARPKYPCDECGAQLVTRGSLRRHKAAYHNDGKTMYVCSICGKVAASEYGLLNHKKNVHQDERKHKCTYCDKAFKRPKILREHIATHTGEDLYQCPHCPRTFKVSSNMHHHRKKAHPVEFEEGRKNRLQLRKVDITQVTNQVVI